MSSRNENTFFIGLDLGTSAIKAVLMDINGKIFAIAEKHTEFIKPGEGRIEVDPGKHYQDVCAVIRELASRTSGTVRGIAMAAASGNTLLTDAEGQPLTNIINWMDHRAEQEKPEILNDLTAEYVWDITGWPCVNSFPLGHLAWLREHQPELYRSAGRYCMNTDWLLFRLTGNWIMDHSTATTFHLQHQTSGRWHKPFLDMLNISEDKLSSLTDSSKSAGMLSAAAAHDTGLSADTEVFTGSFDHPAAARAAGILEQSQLMLSCGTSWVGFFPEKDRGKIIKNGLLCDTFLSSSGGPWGAVFSIPYIGQNIDWYVNNLIAPGAKDKYKIFNELAAESEAGAGGMKIDLRETPLYINAEKKNISRAVMESAANLLQEKLLNMESKGMKFKTAVMVGAPSRSPVWPGIVESITGLKLTVGTAHSGAKGAAIMAGIGAGAYRDEYEAAARTK